MYRIISLVVQVLHIDESIPGGNATSFQFLHTWTFLGFWGRASAEAVEPAASRRSMGAAVMWPAAPACCMTCQIMGAGFAQVVPRNRFLSYQSLPCCKVGHPRGRAAKLSLGNLVRCSGDPLQFAKTVTFATALHIASVDMLNFHVWACCLSNLPLCLQCSVSAYGSPAERTPVAAGLRCKDVVRWKAACAMMCPNPALLGWPEELGLYPAATWLCCCIVCKAYRRFGWC